MAGMTTETRQIGKAWKLYQEAKAKAKIQVEIVLRLLHDNVQNVAESQEASPVSAVIVKEREVLG